MVLIGHNIKYSEIDGSFGGPSPVARQTMGRSVPQTHDIHDPKPYEFIWFGDIHDPKPCEFTCFGDIHDPKPYEFTWFGDIHDPKPYEFTWLSA